MFQYADERAGTQSGVDDFNKCSQKDSDGGEYLTPGDSIKSYIESIAHKVLGIDASILSDTEGNPLDSVEIMINISRAFRIKDAESGILPAEASTSATSSPVHSRSSFFAEILELTKKPYEELKQLLKP
ncbi:hypothetical protein [Legionella sp. CNM-4043-24]|uniref:hypothetical protein n=1 Tax=Legionella sp. CNM-4043-24 TaxID=3421646 RepID=UPI00403AA249